MVHLQKVTLHLVQTPASLYLFWAINSLTILIIESVARKNWMVQIKYNDKGPINDLNIDLVAQFVGHPTWWSILKLHEFSAIIFW